MAERPDTAPPKEVFCAGCGKSMSNERDCGCPAGTITVSRDTPEVREYNERLIAGVIEDWQEIPTPYRRTALERMNKLAAHTKGEAQPTTDAPEGPWGAIETSGGYFEVLYQRQPRPLHKHEAIAVRNALNGLAKEG